MRFPLYVPAMNVITYVQIGNFYLRGGDVFSHIVSQSFWLDPSGQGSFLPC